MGGEVKTVCRNLEKLGLPTEHNHLAQDRRLYHSAHRKKRYRRKFRQSLNTRDIVRLKTYSIQNRTPRREPKGLGKIHVQKRIRRIAAKNRIADAIDEQWGRDHEIADDEKRDDGQSHLLAQEHAIWGGILANVKEQDCQCYEYTNNCERNCPNRNCPGITH